MADHIPVGKKDYAIWQPITTVPKDWGLRFALLWNGRRVFAGWRSGDGWHDIENQDWWDEPKDPQPTHWMPFPSPPDENQNTLGSWSIGDEGDDNAERR